MHQVSAPTAPDATLRRYDSLFIDGGWREPNSGRMIESIEPGTGHVWAEVPEADAADVAAAVDAARRAFESPSWQRSTGRQRAELLRRLADLITANVDELAEIETRDNGKALRETRGRELPGIPEWLKYFAGYADKIHGDTIPLSPDFQTFTIREPVGVVAGILPWNAPIAGVVWKLAPAIAAGNTIVLKPAEFTSVTALELARLIQEADFPAGVVNIVPGFGVPAGEALVTHMGVDKIAFTGETKTAREITVKSVGNLKRMSFELGGKSANILFADADYDTAVPGTAEAAFIAAGQSCSLGSRIFVQKPIYDRVVSDLVATASNIRVGDPLDEHSQMGAQTTLEQLEKIESYVESARDAGAEILCGGERAEVPGHGEGYFYRPTIISAVTPEMAVFQEEIFGPVVTLMPFDTEEEAIELANGTCYGLGAGFWTTNLSRAHRVARALRAGSVWINTFRYANWALPFGGVKQSGYGRENGLEVISMYTETKTVAIDHTTDRPRWFS